MRRRIYMDQLAAPARQSTSPKLRPPMAVVAAAAGFYTCVYVYIFSIYAYVYIIFTFMYTCIRIVYKYCVYAYVYIIFT